MTGCKLSANDHGQGEVLAKTGTAKHWFFKQAGNCCSGTVGR